MPVLIAILSVIKYNFVSYIYKIRYFIAHSASIGISNINIPYIWNTYLFCRSGCVKSFV